MTYRACGLLLLTALVMAAYLPGRGLGQGVEHLPTAPVPVAPPPVPRAEYPAISPSFAPGANPPSALYPPPQATPEYQPPREEDGWYLSVETDALIPHIKNRLTASVSIDALQFTDIVHVPQAELDWSGSARFEFGYRLPDNMGAFVLGYRFMTSEGKAVVGNYDPLGDGLLQSRLDVQVVDLDYAGEIWKPGPRWEVGWRLGARLSSVYFDSLIVGAAEEQRTSNHFVGAGPHVSMDVARRFGGTWSIFGRVDAATLIGQVRQGFEETWLFPDGALFGGATAISKTQAVPVLNFQLGLGWAPTGSDWLRFTGGYQYERWWLVGQAGDSRGDLWDQGLFFRAEMNF